MLKVCFLVTQTYVFDRTVYFLHKLMPEITDPVKVEACVINKRQQITYKLQMTT